MPAIAVHVRMVPHASQPVQASRAVAHQSTLEQPAKTVISIKIQSKIKQKMYLKLIVLS